MPEIGSVILDVVVLLFLGITIIYIFRLSRSLDAFKGHRREFDRVVTDLLSSIDQAERSVRDLKQVSTQEALALETLITQSKALSEELKIINDASESMAKRLEILAAENRRVAQHGGASKQPASKEIRKGVRKISSPLVDGSRVEQRKNTGDAKGYSQTLRNVSSEDIQESESADIPDFMIRDPEFSNSGNKDGKPHHVKTHDFDDDIMPEQLQSQAERDLLAALRAGRQDIKGGGQ